ncbi:MAG: glycosyl hydrolase, partial [Pirellulales bacterium]
YFWSPGSAWDEASIQYNLRKYHEAGFGTLNIVPIYGARGAENRTIEFLTPEWMRMLDFFVRKTRGLGMQIDMTTGTGWCFGGPGLDGRTADLQASYDAATGGLTFTTRRMVERAAPGGQGHMLNPYSPAAMRFYLERFNRAFDGAFDGAQPAMPRAQYHDSFEYDGNWSVELLEAFRQRHGYDLSDHLETLFGAQDEGSRSRIKYDYRVLLGELHYQTIKVWTDWARSRGMLTRNQAHGSPSNLIDTYALCDIPETEMFGAPDYPIPGFHLNPRMARKGDVDLRICMLPSSAAHIAHRQGKQLVSAESCTWLREHWHTALAHVKLQLDEFFLAGVNHVFYHGSCYSPKEAPWPGWFFYASTKFDWHNAFWRDLPILNTYVANCQSVLQAGQPDNDLLLYWPIHDVWMQPEGTRLSFTVHKAAWMDQQPVGKVAAMLMRRGFAFDFISDRLLQGILSRDGLLHATGGTYRAMVVPQCNTIPVATLGKLAELVEQGATVIFARQLPTDVPGWGRLEERREQIASMRARLREAGPIVAADLAAALQQGGIPREPMADAGLKFIRRRVKDKVYYFIVNHTAESYDDCLTLATPVTSATLFDPMTHASGQLAVRNRDGLSQVYLQIASGESRFLRISPTPGAGRQWISLVPSGEPFLLDRSWQVEFIQGGPTLPASYQTARLTSWTEAPDQQTQRL